MKQNQFPDPWILNSPWKKSLLIIISKIQIESRKYKFLDSLKSLLKYWWCRPTLRFCSEPRQEMKVNPSVELSYSGKDHHTRQCRVCFLISSRQLTFTKWFMNLPSFSVTFVKRACTKFRLIEIPMITDKPSKHCCSFTYFYWHNRYHRWSR
jgi:hypothetical protein